MKKITIIFCLLVSLTFCFFGMDNTSDVKNYSQNSLVEFLKENVGNQISVYIKGADITFRGELLTINYDGIVIITLFKQRIYIPKDSIGYIEIKEATKEKEQKSK
ncbi:MAG TPA: hypothetical protein PLE45_08920 [Spirochaetota bacterium]|nr:hypothetical protein [Spirochaetota bacterium]HOL57842.1 hypothetical protein [Spirochaetota bacterium]HPP05433.1 hypothetical protein [Spirochaetota bacterium]